VDVNVTSQDGSTGTTTDLDFKDTWHVALGAQYQVAEPWLLSCGAAYDSSMIDDEQRGPTLPVGETWRFGVGGQYAWSQRLTLSGAYELAWGGDLPMDVQRGQSNRVSGTYRDTAMHAIMLGLDWKF
jgi:long-chain fatty acid transport protein